MSKSITISLSHLEAAVRNFALEHSINEIPRSYYETAMNTWGEMNKQNHNWDNRMAAAALMYAAVVDGFVHRSQMTPSGYRAYNWAEAFMHKLHNTAQSASDSASELTPVPAAMQAGA